MNVRYALGLIGFPLEQSHSPRLHTASLAAVGLEGDYRLNRVPPLPDGDRMLADLMDQVRSGAIQGLNVTIPHKQSIIPHLDGLTREAEAIGAVNTIYGENGRAIGDNTDAPGFLSDLKRVAGRLFSDSGGRKTGFALVLGAGGAARAVTYALWQTGWQVVIAARRQAQAQTLVQDIQQSLIRSVQDEGDLSAICLDVPSLMALEPAFESRARTLLVNASSSGMIPNVNTSPWPDRLPLPPGVFVYDLVCKPLETRLIREARQAGFTAENGLGMLVEQAALAFERWTGLKAPRQAMWQAVGGAATPEEIQATNQARTGADR